VHIRGRRGVRVSAVRYAIRSIRRSPILAAIAVASLALGIGANLTVYSAVRELILDDISARRLDQLVRVDTNLTYAAYRDLRQAGPFQEMAFETGIHDTNWQTGGHAEIAWLMDTSPNFFEVLGVRPAGGRVYSQTDEGRPLAVVSHGFWSRRLHSDPKVVGRTLQLNGREYTVVGVLPRNYRSVIGHGLSPEVYAPARIDSQQRCHPFGRMRDGATRSQTRALWTAAAERLGGTEFSRQVSVLKPLGGLEANAASGGDYRSFFVFFVMLFGVAGVLTLIACANVASLLLARGVSRQRQIAVCKALGASRWQVAKPIVAEGLLLVGCGSIAALAIDAFLRDRLSYLRWPNAYNVPFEFHFQSDRGLLLYALLTALAALVICSLQPALSGSKADLGLALKTRDLGLSIGRTARKTRLTSFVGMQVVLSVLLLTLGALFVRSFLHIASTDVGFEAAHTVIAAVHPLPRQYQGESRWRWREQLIRRARQVPGVLGITSTDLLPLMGEVPVAPVRREGDRASALLDVYSMAEGEQYFTTLGIRILRGRDFEIGDRDRKPIPGIVNRTLARQFFGDGDPIGARLLRGREKQDAIEIVGVVADTKMRTLGEGSMPALYTPDYNGQFLVRVAGDARQWIEPLRSALSEVDDASALDIRPMRDALEGAMFPMRVASGFVGSLSGLGLVLALVGLYGSVSYAVGRRTREMGIRAALGATRSRILLTALRDGMAVVAGGTLAGLALAMAAIQPLVDLLPAGVNPWDPLMFAAVGALVLLTGAMAALVPARRAAQVDPSVALRDE
jgi:putative ABC transport system permease protein